MMDLYMVRCCIDLIAYQADILEAAVINYSSTLITGGCRDHINTYLSEIAAEGVLI